MKITLNNLKEFKTIYKKYYGIELSEKEALENANALLNLTKLLINNKI